MALSKANLAILKQYMDTLQEFETLEDRMKEIKKMVYETLSVCFESETVPDNVELEAMKQAIANVKLSQDGAMEMVVHLSWVTEYKSLIAAGAHPKDAAKHVRKQIADLRAKGLMTPIPGVKTDVGRPT